MMRPSGKGGKGGKGSKRPRAVASANASPTNTADVVVAESTESPASASTSPAPGDSDLVVPSSSVDRSLLQDPIYRIMRRTPRSDVLEVVRCRFGREHCERAAKYFDAYYMRNPLRFVRLQIGCDGPTGLHLFFPRLFHHKHALRTLDLSRNDLCADDVVALCEGLGLRGDHAAGGSRRGDGDVPPPVPATTCLEVLDLSYNPKIGNTGAVQLLNALRSNDTIRAVLLRCVGVDDAGAQELAVLLRQRPTPRSAIQGTAPGEAGFTSSFFSDASGVREPGFFLNLNENRVGACGTVVLGKGLPGYVSLSLCKQRIRFSRKP